MRIAIFLSCFLSLGLTLGCSKKPKEVKPATKSKVKKEPPLKSTKKQPVPKAMPKSATKVQIDEIHNNIKFFNKRIKEQPKSMLNHNNVAKAHLQLARLTGQVEHYKKAKDALDLAYAVDKKKAYGPFYTSATYEYAIHNIEGALTYLEKEKKNPMMGADKLNAIQGMIAGIDYHRGNLKKAVEGYRQVIKARQSSTNIARLGHYYLVTGRYDLARKTYDETIQKAATERSPQQLAWSQLMRGIVELEAGKLDEAMGFFQKADKTFGGWYLIKEHIAEVHASKNQHTKAIALYTAVIEQTPNGEFMDALADVYENKGNKTKATTWRAKAKFAYERDLALVPSSAYGHALDHYLTTNPKKALELAKANHTLRPGMEATLKLAQAHMVNNAPKKALPLITKVIKSPFNTPELHATAAKLFVTLKQTKKAALHEKQAKALNPGAMDDVDWLP